LHICESYDKEPVSSSSFFDANPNIKIINCWKDSKNISQVISYIKNIEELTGINVEYISCGTDIKDLIKL